MEKNKKYTGSWSANNGSTYDYGYEGNNRNKLAADMREICKGNVFVGNSGHWQVVNEDDEVVLSGTCR